MRQVIKERLNELRQEKEYGYVNPQYSKKPNKKDNEYFIFIPIILGIFIGSFFGILLSKQMLDRDKEYKRLIKENKELKEMLYYRDNLNFESP